METAVPSSKLAFWKSRGFGLGIVYYVLYSAIGTWSPLMNIYLQQMGLSGTQNPGITRKLHFDCVAVLSSTMLTISVAARSISRTIELTRLTR